MNTFKNLFYLIFLLILFKSCRIINKPDVINFMKNQDKLINKNSSKVKRLLRSGKFVDLENGRSEIFFTDNIKPKGYLSIVDSLAQDSLVKMIIKNDSIVKNYY